MEQNVEIKGLKEQKVSAVEALENFPTLEYYQHQLDAQTIRIEKVERTIVVSNEHISDIKAEIDTIEKQQKLDKEGAVNRTKNKDSALKPSKKKELGATKATPAHGTMYRNAEEKVLSGEVSWDDVVFHDGLINIRLREYWSAPFFFKDSRRSFNVLKTVYKFRNAPKLVVKTRGRDILQIANIEVLTYYLGFLEIARDLIIPLSQSTHIEGKKYRGYFKSHFQEHLPELFSTDCFKLLCIKADELLPIVPIPELVINSSGAQQIHDSFLFPISLGNTVQLIWESIETSKATYCFQFLRTEV